MNSPLTILYGSQTGNAQVCRIALTAAVLPPTARCLHVCLRLQVSRHFLCVQDVAERIEREAKARHYAPCTLAMDAYDVKHLPHEHAVVLVASTTGQAGGMDPSTDGYLQAG